MSDRKTELGKINVTKKVLRIEDLEDKVRFAVDAYNRAFEKYKRGADSLDDWNMVIKALSLQMEEIRDYIAVAHHNIAVIYAGKQFYEKSIEHLKTALEYNPKYAVAHHNLGLVYQKSGEPIMADKHLVIAAKLGHNAKNS